MSAYRRPEESRIEKIDILLALFPLYSEDLGIDLSEPGGRFRWFLASILFGARISERIAVNTYRQFEMAAVDTPEAIVEAGWDRLVEILDSGGYVRYDFSTASKLIDIMNTLKQKYGSLENLYHQAADAKDVERRLQEFKGIGPVTVQIFLRELRGQWKIQPAISKIAQSTARNLDIDLGEFEAEKLARIETALVKLGLGYCKKEKCSECPLNKFCIAK
jgi:endonuclease III